MDKRRQKEYKEFFEQQKADKKADSIYKEELRKMNRNTDSILMEPSEFKEKYQRLQEEEKRKMIEEREEQQRKADSIQQREDRPSSVKFMDWFMGRKQSGGKITKAKDGNQLVKLDQLTNFTNYNKPQPGGWLSKYE
jgi:chlorite dismutase